MSLDQTHRIEHRMHLDRTHRMDLDQTHRKDRRVSLDQAHKIEHRMSGLNAQSKFWKELTVRVASYFGFIWTERTRKGRPSPQRCSDSS